MSELTGVSRDALHDAKINAERAMKAAQDSQVQLRGPANGGWAQLGGRTLVDAVAAIGVHLGLPGFADVKAPKAEARPDDSKPVTYTQNN